MRLRNANAVVGSHCAEILDCLHGLGGEGCDSNVSLGVSVLNCSLQGAPEMVKAIAFHKMFVELLRAACSYVCHHLTQRRSAPR